MAPLSKEAEQTDKAAAQNKIEFDFTGIDHL